MSLKTSSRDWRSLLGPIGWRYSALVSQFLIVTLIARRASLSDAGTYFAMFGLVSVGFAAAGFGATDGLVRLLPPLLRRHPGDAQSTVASATWLCFLSAVPLGTAIAILARHLFAASVAVALLTALWWFGYTIVFLGAQATLGLGKPSQGAFLAYSCINLVYLVVQVPYLFLVDTVTLSNLLIVAVLCTFCAAAISLIVAASLVRRLELPNVEPRRTTRWRESAQEMLTFGFPMMCTRLMQSSLPWTPVWILTATGRPADAAIYAAASRLAVAVTSVVAALRFSVRPRIVNLSDERDWQGISRLARQCSIISAIPPLSAILFLPFVGNHLLTSLLGSSYSQAGWVLEILMLGVLGESFGGISDEILKMTGKTRVVLLSLVAAVICQLLASAALAPLGVIVVAGATAASFVLQYALQAFWISRNTPITIWLRGRASEPDLDRAPA